MNSSHGSQLNLITVRMRPCADAILCGTEEDVIDEPQNMGLSWVCRKACSCQKWRLGYYTEYGRLIVLRGMLHSIRHLSPRVYIFCLPTVSAHLHAPSQYQRNSLPLSHLVKTSILLIFTDLKLFTRFIMSPDLPTTPEKSYAPIPWRQAPPSANPLSVRTHPSTTAHSEDHQSAPPPLFYDLRSRVRSITIVWTILVVLTCIQVETLYFALRYGAHKKPEDAVSIPTTILLVLSILSIGHRTWQLVRPRSTRRPSGGRWWGVSDPFPSFSCWSVSINR